MLSHVCFDFLIGCLSTLRFGPRLADVPRTSSAPVNSVVRSSIPTMSDIKKRLFKRGIFNETSGIRTPDNLIKSQVLYHLSYTPIINWASWIRTNECRNQNPVPYRLAIAQQ